jgi:hypothetical protein
MEVEKMDFSNVKKQLCRIIKDLDWKCLLDKNITDWKKESKINTVEVIKEYIYILNQYHDNNYGFTFHSGKITYYDNNQLYYIIIFGNGNFIYFNDIDVNIIFDSIKIYNEIFISKNSLQQLNQAFINGKNIGSHPIKYSNDRNFIFEDTDPKLYDEEIFLPCKRFEDYIPDNKIIVEISNYGRIRWDNKIHPQYFDNKKIFSDDRPSNVLKINNVPVYDNALATGLKIHRMVAATFIPRYFIMLDKYIFNDEYFSKFYRQVHHINNNGYDARLENLLWVTQGLHNLIERSKIY